jgi:hypothetical protein
MTVRINRYGTVPLRIVAALCFAACSAVIVLWVSKGGDQNLWSRDFAKSQSGTIGVAASELTGYWEGEIAMGTVRAKIEDGQIILAIKCDRDGRIVAQGSAPISVKKDIPSRMILQTDLLSGGGEVCGFRFNKGSEFAYAFGPQGVLKINFAGTSVSELRKLSDLEATK